MTFPYSFCYFWPSSRIFFLGNKRYLSTCSTTSIPEDMSKLETKTKESEGEENNVNKSLVVWPSVLPRRSFDRGERGWPNNSTSNHLFSPSNLLVDFKPFISPSTLFFALFFMSAKDAALGSFFFFSARAFLAAGFFSTSSLEPFGN